MKVMLEFEVSDWVSRKVDQGTVWTHPSGYFINDFIKDVFALHCPGGLSFGGFSSLEDAQVAMALEERVQGYFKEALGMQVLPYN